MTAGIRLGCRMYVWGGEWPGRTRHPRVLLKEAKVPCGLDKREAVTASNLSCRKCSFRFSLTRDALDHVLLFLHFFK